MVYIELSSLAMEMNLTVFLRLVGGRVEKYVRRLEPSPISEHTYWLCLNF